MSNNKVLTHLKNDIFTITLNRPEKSNCYDLEMVIEIKSAFLNAKHSNALCILFTANGKNFSSGMDLNWMSNTSSKSSEENLAEMAPIKDMYEAILEVEIPIIGKIQGAVRGGGLGLVACCDAVFCEETVTFSLSEAKWGLIPGIITPILVQKIGPSNFLEIAISSRVFSFEEARRMNLVHHNVDFLETYLELVKENSLTSTKMIKKIIHDDYFSHQSLEKMLKLSNDMRNGPDFKLKRSLILKRL